MTDYRQVLATLLEQAETATTLEHRMDKLLDGLPGELEKIAPELQKYPSAGEFPQQLSIQFTALLTAWMVVGSLSLGKDAFQALLKELLPEQAGADPFIQARDAQLQEGPARWQIECYLNSLPQASIEHLAQAVQQGAGLKPVVRLAAPPGNHAVQEYVRGLD